MNVFVFLIMSMKCELTDKKIIRKLKPQFITLDNGNRIHLPEGGLIFIKVDDSIRNGVHYFSFDEDFLVSHNQQPICRHYNLNLYKGDICIENTSSTYTIHNIQSIQRRKYNITLWILVFFVLLLSLWINIHIFQKD